MNLYVDLLNTIYYQENLFALTGARIVILDSNFNEVSFYPPNHSHSAFCDYIRSTPEGYRRCMKCDNQGLYTVQKMRSRHKYCCHAGLTEAITPIMHGDNIIGYIVLGQFLDSSVSLEVNWEYVCNCCSDFLDVTDAKDLFLQLPRMNRQQIDACFNILDAILSLQYIAPLHNPGYEQIQSYIAEHLEDTLTLEIVSNGVFMSPAKVNSLLKKYAAMTLTEYVLTARLEKAKLLLKDSDKAIYEIADLCGIPDYNYFSRVFRKKYGTSPSDYKKTYSKKI